MFCGRAVKLCRSTLFKRVLIFGPAVALHLHETVRLHELASEPCCGGRNAMLDEELVSMFLT
jgi:hypothetical protein